MSHLSAKIRRSSTHGGTPSLQIKRAYEPPKRTDGFRVLVDRLWPRGIAKDTLALDAWHKDVAPSDELRRWFAHDPLHWNEFVSRYQLELGATSASALLEELAKKSRAETVTLVYGARDEKHNHAIVLQNEIERRARTASRARATSSRKAH